MGGWTKCAIGNAKEVLLEGSLVRLDASLSGVDRLLARLAGEGMVHWGPSVTFSGCELVRELVLGLEEGEERIDELEGQAFVFVLALDKTTCASKTRLLDSWIALWTESYVILGGLRSQSFAPEGSVVAWLLLTQKRE